MIEKNTINGCDDMLEGCGLTVTPKVLSIDSIYSKNMFYVETGLCRSCVQSALELAFHFEAGYTITGEYTATVSGSTHSGNGVLSDTQDCIQLIRESELEFDISLSESYNLPFNNWRVLAHSEKILGEIKGLVGNSWDEVQDDNIIFTGDDESSEVAYGLLNNINNRDENPTGLTKEVVQQLHNDIKSAMIDALIKRDEKIKSLADTSL